MRNEAKQASDQIRLDAVSIAGPEIRIYHKDTTTQLSHKAFNGSCIEPEVLEVKWLQIGLVLVFANVSRAAKNIPVI